MHIPDIIIAIDGYSSTGKSSFARLIASEFSFLYLDSGAMYRAVTLMAIEKGLIDSRNDVDVTALESALKDFDLRFMKTGDGSSMTFIGERCVEKEIRSMEVSAKVSPVATIPCVRKFVDMRLRDFGKKKRVVMDGRDIGTTVFPEAEIKIFMVADLRIRAERRAAEMIARGEETTMEKVMENLQERDFIDSHRQASPLAKAPDALVLDNSRMTLQDQLVWIKGIIEERYGKISD